jgi:hypothetical protein
MYLGASSVSFSGTDAEVPSHMAVRGNRVLRFPQADERRIEPQRAPFVKAKLQAKPRDRQGRTHAPAPHARSSQLTVAAGVVIVMLAMLIIPAGIALSRFPRSSRCRATLNLTATLGALLLFVIPILTIAHSS